MILDLPQPEPNDLQTPIVKPHTQDKHHWLRRYLHAFTTSMADKWKLHYIDLFAGAGIELVEGIGSDWGSPLLAAQMPRKFNRLHLCELDQQKFRALTNRLSRFPQPNNPQLLSRDANEICDQIVTEIPNRGTLSLAFLDPYGLHLDLETVRQLSFLRIDLLIFFPDHSDALRNWAKYYHDQKRSKLDSFLGRKDWREKLSATAQERHPEILWQMYKESLHGIGFQHFDFIRICQEYGQSLYRLIFASKHHMGLEIWRNVTNKGRGGQYGLDYPT